MLRLSDLGDNPQVGPSLDEPEHRNVRKRGPSVSRRIWLTRLRMEEEAKQQAAEEGEQND